jgi:cytochrome P450
MVDTAHIDVTNPQFKANPYPIYEQLRREAPVCRVRVGRWLSPWLITRYDDVVTALKDERFTKDPWKAQLPFQQMWIFWLSGPFAHHMLSSDEPDHTRLRDLVQRAFTPRLVEGLRPRIESLTEELLDRAAGQNRIDVIHDYALPLPTTVIAEILGVPVSDRQRFQRWSAAMVDVAGPLQILRSVPSFRAFFRYIRELVKQRRQRPENDLISALVAAEEADDKLNEDELRAMVLLLLVAGYETTVILIGNGTLALIENPGESEKLRAQPSLMPSAVEELLRYSSPLEMATQRWALRDIEIAGVTIPKGDLVAAGIASANRDPQQFERPDALTLTREPNRHVAFGLGIHHCLGAQLARLEAQIAFTTLLQHFPQIRLAVPRNGLRWRTSLFLRGLEALPVASA